MGLALDEPVKIDPGLKCQMPPGDLALDGAFERMMAASGLLYRRGSFLRFGRGRHWLRPCGAGAFFDFGFRLQCRFESLYIGHTSGHGTRALGDLTP
jgi:hypothetical protein